MLTIQGVNGNLGGWWDSVSSVFSKVSSAAAPVVNAQIDSVKQQIRDEAGIGAKQAVAPYVYASIGASVIAIAISVTALMSSRKKA